MTTGSASFEGRSISSPRFVWDQAAHKWHGEDCKIVLLALPTVDEASRGEVEAIIAGRGVTSYTCYLAYGSYDILIRMWCTPYEKDFVVRGLNMKYSYPEMEVFDVVNIDYSRWSSGAAPADDETVIQHLDSIRRFAENPSDLECASDLMALGLLHKHSFATLEEVIDETRIRIYILLRRTFAVDALNVGRLNAIEAALGRLDFLEMPSVYYGQGRSVDCIIKGFIRANDLPSFHHNVIALRQNLADRQIDLRPMTLILAQDGEVERDFLRAEVATGLEDPDVRRLKAVLSVEAAERWDDLDLTLRHSISSLYAETWPKVSNSSFARPLIDLVEGIVLSDEYRVNGSLTFLITVEARFSSVCLGKLFPGAASDPSVGAGDWRERVKEVLEARALEADTPEVRSRFTKLVEAMANPRSLGFGEMFGVLSALVEAGALEPVFVQENLGDRWHTLPGVIDARNKYAHGNMLFSPASPLLKWWADNAQPIMTAGKFLAGLDRVENL